MVERHVRTATVLTNTDDQAMAFTAEHEGSWNALAAVFAVEPLRVRPVSGAHRNAGVAVTLIIDDVSLEEFDWKRQVRNATDHPDADRPTATKQDIYETTDVAVTLIEACLVYVRNGG